MDYKDWIILKIISEEQTITKAAEKLYISQPALSKRIRNMEKEIGAKVVLRNNTGVIFTPEGEHLLAHAREALKKLELTKDRIQNMKNRVCGSLHLGTSSVFAHCELPAILHGFSTCYPNVDISVKTGLSSKITKMLQKEDIAVAVVRGDHFWPEEKQMLREESLCLASFRPIDFKELPYLPRVNYGSDTGLRDMVHNWWFETFACPPHISMEVDSMSTCLQMVLHNLGWAILPEIGLRGLNSLFTQKLYWCDGTPVLRRTWLLYRNGSLELSVVNAFVNYLQDYYTIKK